MHCCCSSCSSRSSNIDCSRSSSSSRGLSRNSYSNAERHSAGVMMGWQIFFTSTPLNDQTAVMEVMCRM